MKYLLFSGGFSCSDAKREMSSFSLGGSGSAAALVARFCAFSELLRNGESIFLLNNSVLDLKISSNICSTPLIAIAKIDWKGVRPRPDYEIECSA